MPLSKILDQPLQISPEVYNTEVYNTETNFHVLQFFLQYLKCGQRLKISEFGAQKSLLKYCPLCQPPPKVNNDNSMIPKLTLAC